MLILLLSCTKPVAPANEALGEPRSLVDLVDPMIGTGGHGYSVGCAFPGAAWPFGLVKASPDTADISGSYAGFYRGGGYHAEDELVRGFTHLHLHAVGVTAYGVVGLMPAAGWDDAYTDERPRWLLLDKASEQASPGRYAAQLQSQEGAPVVGVQIAATEHTALHTYTFAEGASPTVVLDLEQVLEGGLALGASVSLDPGSGRFIGYMDNEGGMGPAFRTWVAGVMNPPPSAWGVWGDGPPDAGGTEAQGVDAGAWFGFDPEALEGGQVSVRIALSMTDQDGAIANLEAEHRGFDVEADAGAAKAAWAALLDRVSVWGGEHDEAVIFATALYHTLLMPTVISDVDGRYRGFDDQIHTSEHPYHTDFSLWDTYRTVHPLYTLLWPEIQADMLRSLARMAEQGGALPLWPLATYDASVMLGSPATIVAGESWQKGLLRDGSGAPDADALVLLNAALAESTGAGTAPYGNRPDVSTYDALGYYASDLVGRSVAWTQEVAIADAALAPMAEDLGYPEAAAALTARGGFWRNVYDAEVGFFHARRSDGSFEEDFDPSAWLDEYAEGDAWQYLWLVPHDPEGLIEVLGGAQAAAARLDDFFQASEAEGRSDWPTEYYWHGNEPDIHAPWLLALAGRPDLARTWVDWVAETFYSDQPDGLAGNDDGGTLSAWYALSAMGLFPLAGTDRYVLGPPRFDRVELPAGDGVFTVIGGAAEAPTLDGQPWTEPDLVHGEIRGGVELGWGG